MPMVRVERLEGRSSSVKAERMAQVTNAVVTPLGVDAEQVRVVLYEIPHRTGHWAVAQRVLTHLETRIA